MISKTYLTTKTPRASNHALLLADNRSVEVVVADLAVGHTPDLAILNGARESEAAKNAAP